MNENKWYEKYRDDQIDALKSNWTVNCGCASWMQEAFKEMPSKLIGMRGEDGFCFMGVDKTGTYYLDPSWQRPKAEPVAEEGYRIVSMKDRERCAYPEDCKVRWCEVYRSYWRDSVNKLGWNDNESEGKEFAVPLDYVFAEDRPKEVEYEVLGVETDRIGNYISENGPFITSLMGNFRFAGLQFEGQKRDDIWHMSLRGINPQGKTCELCNAEYKPAVPVRIRLIKE